MSLTATFTYGGRGSPTSAVGVTCFQLLGKVLVASISVALGGLDIT